MSEAKETAGWRSIGSVSADGGVMVSVGANRAGDLTLRQTHNGAIGTGANAALGCTLSVERTRELRRILDQALGEDELRAAAPQVRAIVDALTRGKALVWNGSVLVEVDVGRVDLDGQATMVLDGDDLDVLGVAAPIAACRECGCTEANACTIVVDDDHGTCSWAAPGLCTACVPGADPRWRHPAARPLREGERVRVVEHPDHALPPALEGCTGWRGYIAAVKDDDLYDVSLDDGDPVPRVQLHAAQLARQD